MNSSWLAFVGGKYTPEAFLEEAKAVGSTRRVSAQEVKRMSYGDRVIFCYLPKKGDDRTPIAFAEMRICNIVLDGPLGELVTNALEAAGYAERLDSAPVQIERKCGSYILTGVTVVTCEMEQVVATAEQVSAETSLPQWYMIGGHPVGYDTPVRITDERYTKKMRGFTLCPPEANVLPAEQITAILQVEGYQQG